MSFFDLPAANLDALVNAQPAQPATQTVLNDNDDAATRVVFVARIPHGLMSVFHRAGVPVMEADYQHGVPTRHHASVRRERHGAAESAT